MLIDSNELVHSDYHYSSESSLGCWHELQHRHPRALPNPLLCARPDRPPQQWVCGPVHPALHQPEERWAAQAERARGGSGGWESDEELNYIRWHCVAIIVFPLVHSVSNTEGCSMEFFFFIENASTCCIYVMHTFSFSCPPFLRHLQATAGFLCGPEKDAAWIQPPSLSLFGIPKNSSPYQTHTHTQSLTGVHTHTSRQQTEKRGWCSNFNNNKKIYINKSKAPFPQI